MPRELSYASLNALLSQQTGDAYLILLKIIDQSDVEYLFTSDTVNTIIQDKGLPSPIIWDSQEDDPSGYWTDHKNNTFTYSRPGDAVTGARIYNNDTTRLIQGFTYDVAYTISNSIGDFKGQLWLGNNRTTRWIADGSYIDPVVYDGTGNPWFDLSIFQLQLGAASYDVSLDYILPVGQTPAEGIVYEAFPFDVLIPKNVDGEVSTAKLVLDNVDRRLINQIRSQTEPLRVSYDIVLASNPVDILASFTDFKLRQVSYDAISISGSLTMEDFLNEPVGSIMSGQNFPGLFFV